MRQLANLGPIDLYQLFLAIHQFFMPSCQNKNEKMSVRSSTCLEIGFPAPCPALLSMRNRMGRSRLSPLAASDCISAAIFLACMGSTRVSVSAVMNKIAG